ncbi:cupin domain-containing protein [Streptomyces sp. NPDC002172]
MAELKRYVVGLDDKGKSAVLQTGVSNQQEFPGFFWRATLWKTRETPVDNSIAGDRSVEGGAARSPFPNGMLVRAMEFWPEPDPETAEKLFADLNKVAAESHQPTQAEKLRHPTMHKTDTLDVFHIVRGEIYLVLDEDEILLKPSDTVVIQGTHHGWSNRGTEPCLILGSMTDALPRELAE